MDKKKIIEAAKATYIPESTSSLWSIHKKEIKEPRIAKHRGKERFVFPGTITYLSKFTEASMHLPHGEIIMEDSIYELNTHMGFMLKAKGNILITGLGLGCVIRGSLANGNAMHITCIERSKDVLKLVEPYMPAKRLEIIEADALEWTKENKFKFDYAWHDLFTDQSAGEPHLDVWHTKLIINCTGSVKNQGAWAFSRVLKQIMSRKGLKLIA